MKVIVAGGRDFNNYELLHKTMVGLSMKVDEVVCGCARGADTLGEQWAKEHNIPVVHFEPNWDLYGNSAGFIRNAEMAEYADFLVAFWDLKSKGTEHMIETMKRKGKGGLVVPYEIKE